MLAPELAALIDSDRRDVLSVALDVDPAKPEHQSEPPAWRIWLRNELRALLDRLPAAERKTAEDAAARVLPFLEHERPAGKGLAIFAAADLWQVSVLPVPLRSRVRYGRPDLLPLLWAAEEYRPYAVLTVSKEHVRLLVAYLGGTAVAQAETLELDTSEWRFKTGRPPSFTRRTGTGAARGTQRDTFEARVDEHRRRLWQGAAEAAGRWLQETGIERLIIAGADEAASAVRSLLPQSAQARVVAVVPVRSDLDSAAIHRATIPVILRAERAREQALVDDILARAGTAGTVVGVGPALEAVARENVLTLAADRDVEAEVAACTRCGHVTAAPAGTCPACGGPVERTALSQLLPLLARRSGARLEMVGGEAAARLRAHGGLGAVLRYTVP
jgi:peptide chain release factor subunit 1